jgi:molybdopterin-guanine dinucleotide biosynthesis protein A
MTSLPEDVTENRLSGRIPVGGLVLCGGRSRRMGRAKLALPFGDETMLERVVRILGEVVTPIVVVAARDQQLPELSDDVLIVRDEQDDLGPLGGLAVGLEAMEGIVDAAFVSSCDAPLLQPAFVQRMIELLGSHEVAVPKEDDYYHPLSGMYRTSLGKRAQQLIANDQRRPLHLIEQSDAFLVDVETLRDVDPQLDSLRNTNTVEDYRRALHDAGFDAAVETDKSLFQ